MTEYDINYGTRFNQYWQYWDLEPYYTPTNDEEQDQ